MSQGIAKQPAAAGDPLAQLQALVGRAAAVVASTETIPSGVTLERPKSAKHGDFATNAAMVCAPLARDNPRNVAKLIGEQLQTALGDKLAAADVAGPGFLNLRMTDRWYRDALRQVLAAGDRFGSGRVEKAEKINVEFVSANPTGPMHLGHGRNAAYGDALCRVLEFAGHNVGREFYINDYGSQVIHFGTSVAARARGEQPPEDGYQGEYVKQVAEAIPDAAELSNEQLADQAIALMLEQARATLDRMGVTIETWFSERTLHEDGSFQAAITALENSGHVYEHESALWLRTSDLGDDKDRVLRRSNGEYTYFATDIAYHADKLKRGYERLIDVLGADHHGYVGRMRAAVQALGGNPDSFEPVIMQLVNLSENGQRVQMSKRSGEFVTVDDLLDDIGSDALRFFMVQRSHDTTMDLDLALARERSDKNPVYYVQYAHARIASILRKAEAAVETAAADTVGAGADTDSANGSRTQTTDGHALHPSERGLTAKLLEFPAEIAETCLRRSPHRLTIYSRELAAAFSAFYRDCKVIDDDPEIRAYRLSLCSATRQTLARSLDLIGVSAPQQM